MSDNKKTASMSEEDTNRLRTYTAKLWDILLGDALGEDDVGEDDTGESGASHGAVPPSEDGVSSGDSEHETTGGDGSDASRRRGG